MSLDEYIAERDVIVIGASVASQCLAGGLLYDGHPVKLETVEVTPVGLGHQPQVPRESRIHRAGRGMMGAVTWKAPDVERPEGPLTGPERPMLQTFLDWQRATLLYKCAGLTGEQLARRAIPPSGLSLLGLVRHMTKVERTWFRQRFAGEPVDHPFGGDNDADFERPDPARAAADYARLTEEFKLADAAVANASLDDTFTHRGEVMSLRMIYLHMIEEYARHLGHADLLREQIDGATGE